MNKQVRMLIVILCLAIYGIQQARSVNIPPLYCNDVVEMKGPPPFDCEDCEGASCTGGTMVAWFYSCKGDCSTMNCDRDASKPVHHLPATAIAVCCGECGNCKACPTEIILFFDLNECGCVGGTT